MSVIFVINSDTAVSESLARVIHGAGWHPETFADPRAFLGHPRAEVPACLVLDVELPDLYGLDLPPLFADCPEIPVIFTAKCPMPRAVVLAMKARAVDFLPEPPDEELLLSAIRAALQRSVSALARRTEIRELSTRYASLSRREREVMAKVVAGRLNKLIAADLGISLITVKTHRGRAMRKMKAPSLVGLIAMVARLQSAVSTADVPRSNPSTATDAVSPGSPQRPSPPRSTTRNVAC